MELRVSGDKWKGEWNREGRGEEGDGKENGIKDGGRERDGEGGDMLILK